MTGDAGSGTTPVRLDLRDGIATVCLDRPPVNAFDEALRDALAAVLDELERAGDGVRVVLWHGAGRAFSAGVDIALMRDHLGHDDGPERIAAFGRSLQTLFGRVEQLPFPSIAAVEGAATGGGLELAIACDLRVLAEDARAGLPEARLGLVPGGGGTQRLARLAGTAAALRLVLRGELVDGRQALGLGIAQWALPREEVLLFARELAAELASLPAAALTAVKRCVTASSTQAGLAHETAAAEALLRHPETRQRITSFLQRHERP